MALEDRRALYNAYDLEQPAWVVQSILEMRAELTNALQQTGENSAAAAEIRAMRAACRRFLDDCEKHGPFDVPYKWAPMTYGEFGVALGQLRGVFGHHLAVLCVAYDLDLEGGLGSILPPEPDGAADDGRWRRLLPGR